MGVISIFQVLENFCTFLTRILDKLISLKIHTISIENNLNFIVLLKLVYSVSFNYPFRTNFFQ